MYLRIAITIAGIILNENDFGMFTELTAKVDARLREAYNEKDPHSVAALFRDLSDGSRRNLLVAWQGPVLQEDQQAALQNWIIEQLREMSV